MAISVNNLALETTSSSLLYTPPSLTNPVLVVMVGSEDVSNDNLITGVFFGSTPMTIQVIAEGINGANAADLAIAYLVNPGTTEQNITVSGGQRVGLIVFTLDNVDQTTPIDTFTSSGYGNQEQDYINTGTTSNAGSYVVSGVTTGDWNYAHTWSHDSVEIEGSEASTGNGQHRMSAGAHEQAVAGAFSHKARCAAPQFRAALATVAFNKAAAGGGPPTHTGSGSHQAQAATHSGTGERVVTGAGSHQAQASTHSGSGAVSGQITGSGSHQAANATHSGAGERFIAGSGSHQAQNATHSGTGGVDGAIAGSGSHQAGNATHSGAGERIVIGTGSHQAQAATHAGSGERIVTGAGTHQAESATHSATGTSGKFIIDIDAIATAVAAKIGSVGIDEVTLNRVVQGAIPAPASDAAIAKELLRILPKPQDYSKTLKRIEQRLAELEEPKPETAYFGALRQEVAGITSAIQAIPKAERLDLSPVIKQVKEIGAMLSDLPDNSAQFDDIQEQLLKLEDALSISEAMILEAITDIPQPDLSSIATTEEITAIKALLDKLQNYDDAAVLTLLEQLRDSANSLQDTQERTEKKTDLLLDNQFRF